VPLEEVRTAPTRPIPEAYWVLPARLLAGEYPGIPYQPEITLKRLERFLNAGFDTFIDLTQVHETEPYAPALQSQAELRQLRVQHLRHSIPDYGLPEPQQMSALLNLLQTQVQTGRKTYLHCNAGIGRTGTVVGCYLVRQGYSGKEALQLLAEWWKTVPKSARYPHSPETTAQEEYILHWKD
jgi:hypothetical protein